MTLYNGVQERLDFVAQHIGILPYGFSGNSSYYTGLLKPKAFVREDAQ